MSCPRSTKKKSILTAKMSSGKSKLSLLVNINQLLTTRPKIL